MPDVRHESGREREHHSVTGGKGDGNEACTVVLGICANRSTRSSPSLPSPVPDLHDEGSRWVMWYHGQDTDWHKEAEGVMDVGTGR